MGEKGSLKPQNAENAPKNVHQKCTKSVPKVYQNCTKSTKSVPILSLAGELVRPQHKTDTLWLITKLSLATILHVVAARWRSDPSAALRSRPLVTASSECSPCCAPPLVRYRVCPRDPGRLPRGATRTRRVSGPTLPTRRPPRGPARGADRRGRGDAEGGGGTRATQQPAIFSPRPVGT